MNTKAERFNKYIQEFMPNFFDINEVDEKGVPEENKMFSVFYQAPMEIDGQNLPLWLIIDKSIFVMFQVRLAMSVVNENNRVPLINYLNDLNETYKAFKYYIDEAGSIILEVVVSSTEEEFNPSLIHYLMGMVVRPHLQEEYKKIMRIVWTK